MAQQVTLVTSMFVSFLVVTVLARTLSLREFGAYGLLISLPTYLFFAQGSIETVAVRAIAQAREQLDRDRAFTTALCLYSILGVMTALLIAFGGIALLGVVKIPHALHHQAELSLVTLALVNLVGWPIKAVQDYLRGCGRFVVSAAVETIGYVTFGALMLVALLLSAPLWVLVGLGGGISPLIGLWAIAATLLGGLSIRARTSNISLTYMRTFVGMSVVLLISGVSDLVVYSLDRTILGLYRSAATVGLYEGPLRAHNLLRGLQGALVYTVMATAAGYVATNDRTRLRELLMRGTRYVALVMMPFTVLLMVLSRPILEVWLGSRFTPASGAMTIFVSYWLLLGGSSVGLSMIIATGRVKAVVIYSTVLATLNLGCSLALTPALGLNGIVLGTSLPYAIMLPAFITLLCRTFDVSILEYLRQGYSVAYMAGATLAGWALLARRLLPIDRPAVLIGVGTIGLVGYAAGVYLLGLAPRERLLVRTTLRGARRWMRDLPRTLATMRPSRLSLFGD
jgi:O-antigen/teichoic acid export membrane protein